ncbi:MAG TPA: tripartite tricarboxylate transporter substrate-binding protein [Burkholderiales bacterium]|nr:tripartite tricarboxylate transporter substrate-binding protein [Burkholderiales bacterium]
MANDLHRSEHGGSDCAAVVAELSGQTHTHHRSPVGRRVDRCGGAAGGAEAGGGPGQINYGSSGTGTGTHLSAELFKYMTGVDMVHIPYKGGGPAVTALLGGQVQLNFATIPSVLPHVRAGRLRAIAVTTAKRSFAAPEVPTIAESGVPGYDHGPWNGMLTSAKTPKWIVAKLNVEVIRIIHSHDIKAVLVNDGSEPIGNTPDEFAAIINAETAKWTKVIKSAGIKAE